MAVYKKWHDPDAANWGNKSKFYERNDDGAEEQEEEGYEVPLHLTVAFTPQEITELRELFWVRAVPLLRR